MSVKEPWTGLHSAQPGACAGKYTATRVEEGEEKEGGGPDPPTNHSAEITSNNSARLAPSILW